MLCYVLAKLTEMADYQIYDALGLLSGHALKHLLAALGAGVVTWRLAQRVKMRSSRRVLSVARVY